MGISILGIIGEIEVDDFLEKPGVMGDFSEDCEDIEVISTGDDEFFPASEGLDTDLSLREKSPIPAVAEGENLVL